MLKQNKNNVKIAFKNLPLKNHEMAKPAALAALAAGEQGKFWQYHDKLFAEKKITQSSLNRIASELDLDVKKFKQDRQSPQLVGLLNRDIVEAGKHGITGTPTVFINGRKLRKRSLDGFQALINQELAKLKEITTETTN